MSIRMVCLALAVLVTPYGWYTWVFGFLAAVLPYIAVVNANAGSSGKVTRAESPVAEIDAPRQEPADEPPAQPTVITIQEHEQGDDDGKTAS